MEKLEVQMLTLFGWKICWNEEDLVTHDIASFIKNIVINEKYKNYRTRAFSSLSKIPVKIPIQIMTEQHRSVNIYILDVCIYARGIVLFVKVDSADGSSLLCVFGVSKVDDTAQKNKLQDPIEEAGILMKKTLLNKYVVSYKNCDVLYDGVGKHQPGGPIPWYW